MPTIDPELITPHLVIKVWSFMTHQYKAQLIDKQNADEMQMIAHSLSLLGVMDTDTFLERYTTTIADRIYHPFDIGIEHDRYTLVNQLVLCAHEFFHVYQYRRDGLPFMVTYLANSTKRAMYEAEAYVCNMEMTYFLGQTVRTPSTLADGLYHYACTKDDVLLAEKMLKMSYGMAKRGGIHNRTSKQVIDYIMNELEGSHG